MAQPARTREEIEQQVLEIQAKNAALAASNGDDEEGRISLSKANMDTDIYGGTNLSGYHTSIPANDDAEYDVSISLCVFENILIVFYRLQDEDTENANGSADNDEYDTYKKAINAFQAPKNYLQDVIDDVSLFNHDPLADRRVPRVADREDEYRRRFRNRQLSPERTDVFAEGKSINFFSQIS
ncbi:hypothetical protein BLA29_008882 [Euroglyphus maynei]|uniref:Uncharacterized protein n=1 Tax=Euroglyphus maynei TaxID=6958 RepID=A0A1Y3B315_EURMA|nr:hypothetical protein BLA29_008882 [Euroglyphus maynei]